MLLLWWGLLVCDLGRWGVGVLRVSLVDGPGKGRVGQRAVRLRMELLLGVRLVRTAPVRTITGELRWGGLLQHVLLLLLHASLRLHCWGLQLPSLNTKQVDRAHRATTLFFFFFFVAVLAHSHHLPLPHRCACTLLLIALLTPSHTFPIIALVTA